MRKVIAMMFVAGLLQAQAGMSKLEALSMLETGDNDRAVGKAGEVSRYQLMPNIWRHYSQSRSYSNPEVSREIAAKHLAVLEGRFQARTGREPSDFDRYVLWNAGETYYAKIGFQAGRVHPVIRERANRFVNLRNMTDQGTWVVMTDSRKANVRRTP
jgi:hypothetical protein